MVEPDRPQVTIRLMPLLFRGFQIFPFLKGDQLKVSYYSTADSTYSNTGYPDRIGPSGKFVENSTKITCFEISGYRIKYSTVLWLTEPKIRRGRKVQTQVHTVNSNSRHSSCQCSLFSKKNPIIQIFCISGSLAVTVNPNEWSSTVYVDPKIYYNPALPENGQAGRIML